MVAIGWAKPLVDFIFWIHFLSIPVDVDPFDAARAAMLVAVTFAVGWVLGAAFAGLWNRLHPQAR